MSIKICNHAGIFEQCKGCSGMKPSKNITICPFALNRCITKFIGILRFKNNKPYIELNGHKIDYPVLFSEFDSSWVVGSEVVCYLTELGIEILRLKTH